MRVLVVEDECLTAHYVAAVIRDQRSEVAGIATTARDALDLIGTKRIDAAFLDVSLHGGTSEAVAAELLRKCIPFSVISGWPDQDKLPPPLNRGRVLQKPYREQYLVSALRELAEMAQTQLSGKRIEGEPALGKNCPPDCAIAH